MPVEGKSQEPLVANVEVEEVLRPTVSPVFGQAAVDAAAQLVERGSAEQRPVLQVAVPAVRLDLLPGQRGAHSITTYELTPL